MEFGVHGVQASFVTVRKNFAKIIFRYAISVLVSDMPTGTWLFARKHWLFGLCVSVSDVGRRCIMAERLNGREQVIDVRM